ncbi:MAG: hypothetical protein GY863_22750 [bacterium]|nr:hypothetical protein [bacterium]
MNKYLILVVIASALCFFHCAVPQQECRLQIAVSFPAELSGETLDGRVFLLISDNEDREPRFQISYSNPNTQLIYGIDVEGMSPGEENVIDGSVFGFPLKSIAGIPPGDYYVQALFHKYETFSRSDGHTLKLPMDRGEGQHWNRAPGNLYSTPEKIHIDPSKDEVIHISLNAEIPPIPDPATTKYVRHVKIKSELLTEFWGRPMYIGAHVLVPEGFDDHPEARYPLFINHGHFPSNLSGFSEDPPESGSRRSKSSYDFYKEWTGPDYPRVLVVQIQHANPYYDDSYAVNSANLGPYGDAITNELIPYIEKEFRGIGQGWARTLYGGSTGGWEAFAVQVFYPDDYNGCWALCPDPVDFRRYTAVDIYKDTNAYYIDSKWKKTPRPGARNALGWLSCTVEEPNHLELVLGTKGRSGGQWDIFQAVYGPVGEDGYPKPIWDKMTGEINRSVAEHWLENYDLRHILERDWDTLGPKLKGKINVYVGDMDTYYLNNAVYLLEEFLESTTSPYYDGVIKYGDRQVHCWTGNNPDGRSVHQRYVPIMVEHILRTAPPGADKSSWKY